jgi:geranylgeranyl pyrophosphate synthase
VHSGTKNINEVNEAISLIRESGALDAGAETARNFVVEGWSQLEASIPPGEAKEHLKDLSDYLINRDI